jgi:hypothetical protein
VDAPSGVGTVVASDFGLALDPTTHDPLFLWRDDIDLLYTLCR